jgi:hypothetical protein
VAVASGSVADSHQAVAASSAPAWPPPDDKRDLTPYAIVRGEHGLLCLQRIEPDEAA